MLTFNVDPPGGGILISGSAEELLGLSEAIAEAANGEGELAGHLLTDDGVEPVVVELVEE